MDKLFKTAFTLIELLVVIAIIGILSGLIVVTMNGVTAKANIAKGQVFSNSLRNALMMNLISEWKFDGTTTDGSPATTNDVLDAWSGGNNGTVANPPTVKTGSNCVSRSCLQFDGNNDYVDFGSGSSLSMGLGDQTISLWVNFDNALAPQYETLAVNGCANTGTGYDGFHLYRWNGTSRLGCNFTDGSATFVSNYLSLDNSLVANTWYNIAVVFDRDGVAQAYINGVRQTGSSLTISSQAGDVQNSQSFKIGAMSSSSFRLAGKMDDVRLYGAIIPVSQIKEQYYSGLNQLLKNGGISYSEYINRINNISKNI
jgi:prepilin-type N-terminal cleavage/methylation domain-containing protein